MRSANPELTLLKALSAVTSNGEGAQDGCSPALPSKRCEAMEVIGICTKGENTK